MKNATDEVPPVETWQWGPRVRTYCRGVLQYFRSHSSESATVEDIVTFFRERGLSDEDEEGIAIYLHHSALPRLADVGHIDYDARSSTVRYRGD